MLRGVDNSMHDTTEIPPVVIQETRVQSRTVPDYIMIGVCTLFGLWLLMMLMLTAVIVVVS